MSKRRLAPELRCTKCQALLVDVSVAKRLERGCVQCDDLVGPIDTVSQIYVRREAK